MDNGSTSYNSDDRLFSQFLPIRSSPILSTSVPSAYGVKTISAKDISNFRRPSEDADSDSNLDTLFDQYLRSLSPPPSLSPKDATSDLSGITPTDAEGDRSRNPEEPAVETFNSPAPEDSRQREGAGDQAEDRRCVSNGPRIRLRASQPKITLRLQLQDISQHGKRQMKGTKGGRKGSKRGKRGRRAQVIGYL